MSTFSYFLFLFYQAAKQDKPTHIKVNNTCKMTLRKQLFSRFCNPGTEGELSGSWVLLFGNHWKLVNFRNFPSLIIAKAKPVIPKRPVTVMWNPEVEANLLREIVRNPCLSWWTKPFRVASPSIFVLSRTKLLTEHQLNREYRYKESESEDQHSESTVLCVKSSFHCSLDFFFNFFLRCYHSEGSFFFFFFIKKKKCASRKRNRTKCLYIN